MTKNLLSMPSQCWALTVYIVGRFFPIPIYPALGTFLSLTGPSYVGATSVYNGHLLPILSPTYIFPVQGQQVPKTDKDSLSKGLLMKILDCVILSVAAQCLVCLSCSHSFNLSLPTYSEIVGLGPRNGLHHPSLSKASAPLFWIPQCPGTQKNVTLFQQ